MKIIVSLGFILLSSACLFNKAAEIPLSSAEKKFQKNLKKALGYEIRMGHDYSAVKFNRSNGVFYIEFYTENCEQDSSILQLEANKIARDCWEIMSNKNNYESINILYFSMVYPAKRMATYSCRKEFPYQIRKLKP